MFIPETFSLLEKEKAFKLDFKSENSSEHSMLIGIHAFFEELEFVSNRDELLFKIRNAKQTH